MIWKDTGWGTILFLAALTQIDPGLYEAAAGRRRLAAGGSCGTSRVPGIRGLIILLLILRLGDSLTVGFEQIILQQKPGRRDRPAKCWTPTSTTTAYSAGQWGVSAAVGLVKGLVGVVLVIGANKIAHIFGEAGVYRKS